MEPRRHHSLHAVLFSKTVAIGYVAVLALVLLSSSVVALTGVLLSGWSPETLFAPLMGTLAIALVPMAFMRSWLP